MTNTQQHILVVVSETQAGVLLERVLRSAQYNVTVIQEGASALRHAQRGGISLVILGERLKDGKGIDTAADMVRRYPAIPTILIVYQDSPEIVRQVLRAGITDIISPPMRTEDILHSVQAALERAGRVKDALLLEARRFTSSLQRQVDEMETLTRLGRQVTGSLDLDSVLASIVDAAVQLTGAEEGSLLLVDDVSGELYMRAGRNFQEDFVRTFRLPITDSLAGAVIRTGEAVLFDESTPQKIKTSYLVQSLLYVPLQMHGRIFGVLGVDNRHSRLPLTRRHVTLMNMLSSYAGIALENARLYTEVLAERNKMKTILSGIQDGVVVVDSDMRLGLVNRAAREAFGIDPDANLAARPFQDIFPQQELLELLQGDEASISNRTEVSPDENRFYSVQMSMIPDIGRVFAMHDITNMKKIDRIKTEFVHTVSHDLRSPLTAILGYVELIDRAGPVTDLQRDFIRRIRVSVHNITHLVDDLLDLGRIESGFDLRKESVRLDQIIRFSADGQKKVLAEKMHHLRVVLPEKFPAVLANSVQMRQMVDHLITNAIKYTHPGGTIAISGSVEQNQVILQFCDTGIGIPAMDLPYIFDKFYRAGNASLETSGTGLGLAIVRSIVENHQGRIWVDSTVGKGTTFTVVLPFIQD